MKLGKERLDRERMMNDLFRFCRFHGENRPKTRAPPRELICCAELLIPHLLKVFIRALRMSAPTGNLHSN